jgi:Kef-type K+ transport system membrane component KefB
VQRPDPQELKRAGQARLVAIVIAVTMILWMGAQWLGGQLGWDTRYVFLFDFAAIAAFLWAMVVTYQIWRGRQG